MITSNTIYQRFTIWFINNLLHFTNTISSLFRESL